MATWAEITKYPNSDEFSGLKTGATTSDIFIFQESNAYSGKQYFYKFNTITETITQVPIAQWTQYGGTYRPTSAMIVHNGSLYGAALVVYEYAPLESALLLQIFKIDKDSGALTILYDSWTPYNGPRIYFDNDGTDDSSISSVKLLSWGASLYVGINAYAPVVVGDSDYTNHTTAILKYWDDVWASVYDIPDGTAYFDSCGTVRAFVGGDLGATYIATRILGANEIVIAGTPFVIVNDGSDFSPYPDAAWQGKLWRENAGDIEYSANYGATWVSYYSYDNTPRLPYYPNHFDYRSDPIIVDKSASTIKVYFDTTLDGSFILDSDYGNFQGIVDYQGAYVVLEADYLGNPCIWVYGRTPKTSAGAIPVGIDIDPIDDHLMITGTTIHGSPFAKEIDIDNLVASGVIASGIDVFYGVSGWMYPHYAAFNFCYLYGYMGLDIKASVFSGVPYCNPILLGLDEPAYIGALRTAPFFDYDYIHFTTVYSGATPSGVLGRSLTGGDTYDMLTATPFPVVSMYRTILDEPEIVGSGQTTFIGASGVYACPIYFMIDENLPLGQRCAGLPAITITDIDGAD